MGDTKDHDKNMNYGCLENDAYDSCTPTGLSAGGEHVSVGRGHIAITPTFGAARYQGRVGIGMVIGG